MNKKFWATTFTLTGTIVGAGILGLPYVFSQSGFVIGFLWLLIIGAIMTFVNLALGEITLRTKGIHQLPGYAEKYLGKWGKQIMLAATIFGIYSALLAYLIGEGESLSKLTGNTISPIVLGIIFWLTMTLLLRGGLKGLKRIETWGVITVIAIIIGIVIKFLPSIIPTNLISTNTSHIMTPIGVIMFALLGFTAIPELRKEIKGQEKLLKKAIILGGAIPIILYTLFAATFIGVLGHSITEVATLSFGPIMTILGIFTMLTSYFVLDYCLGDMFELDFKITKSKNFFLISLAPLILYLLTEFFHIAGFTFILGIGGVISGGTTGILILLMSRKAKNTKRNKSEPEIKIPINLPIIILLSIFFVISILLELFL